MVQSVTYIETYTYSSKQRFEVYDKAIKEIFHDKYTEEAFAGPNSTKPDMEMWSELSEDDEDCQSDSNLLSTKYLTNLMSRKKKRNSILIFTISISLWD